MFKAVANKPRRTVIVIDEHADCPPVVSLCVLREGDDRATILLDCEPATSQEELFEIIRDKFAMKDALIDAL